MVGDTKPRAQGDIPGRGRHALTLGDIPGWGHHALTLGDINGWGHHVLTWVTLMVGDIMS